MGSNGSIDGAASGPALPRQAVTRLLVVLAAATGCLDVFCVTQLGGFFASVVTGNLVRSGHALVALDARPLVTGATAVSGYAVGVAGGTLPLRRAVPGWRLRTEVVMALEAVVLVAVAAGWWASDGRPARATALTLLFGAAAATGMQGIVTIGSGIPGANTTYLTGSLTTVVQGVVLDPHRLFTGTGGIVRLLGLFAGAVLGSATLRVAPLLAPAVAAALVLVVVSVAVSIGRRTARSTSERQQG
ncbi:YoaK family protein [Micromonospora sp. WMMA1363]|uniref:YoaK family protein n=1 Tax=Micromonospora sp. WMMA1363 TaxID=3053985 RepID=UPI00259D22BA|nr:YoaK family protein [Micromonospora sp. WMMA1363]MDM4720885.1 YoaK family protein [Micromonospora sp. WMMA1363]